MTYLARNVYRQKGRMTTKYTLRPMDEVERQTSSTRGSTMSYHSINYFVNAPVTDKRCCGCCFTSPKQILHDVR